MESRLLDLIDELYGENAQTDRTTTGGGCQAKGFSLRDQGEGNATLGPPQCRREQLCVQRAGIIHTLDGEHFPLCPWRSGCTEKSPVGKRKGGRDLIKLFHLPVSAPADHKSGF